MRKEIEDKRGTPDNWQPIKERERIPAPTDEEINIYFGRMHKNNASNLRPSFTVFPSVISSPEFVRYSFKNTAFILFFLRDLSLTQPRVFSQYKEVISIQYNKRKLFEILRSGQVESIDKFSRPASPAVFCAVAYFLGFSSVNMFYFFLESLYSLPYDKMMKGEGVKRGQPWYALNYEDGTSQQGPNSEEDAPI